MVGCRSDACTPISNDCPISMYALEHGHDDSGHGLYCNLNFSEDAWEMSPRPSAGQTSGSSPIPCFPIPPLSLFGLNGLLRLKLNLFYERNVDDFIMLVCVLYAGFVERNAQEPLEGKRAGRKLFRRFCGELKMLLTAARPQSEALSIERPEKSAANVNGLANEFLWNHIKSEGLATWQDYYAGSKKYEVVGRLVDDFVHFVIERAFADPGKCAFYLSYESNLQQARRRIRELNEGTTKLKGI
jgi:hypothetical protein